MSVNGSDILAALNAGSGINAKNLAEQLVAAERAPREGVINRKLDSVTAEISGYGELSSILGALQSAAGSLKDQRDFAGTRVSTASTAMEFQVTDVVDVGTYDIQVTSIAQRQQTVSTGYDAVDTTIGDGSDVTLDVTLGGDVTQITVSNPTPERIVSAIEDADLGLSARLIDDGTGSGGVKMIVTGAAGAENAFSVVSSTDAFALNTNLTSASDASITIDGLSVTRPTNTFADVVPGLSITVKNQTDAAESVVFERDTAGVQTAITDFVDAFNATVDGLNVLSANGLAEGESEGALSGDSTVRFIERTLKDFVLASSSTPGENLSSLNDLGIQFTREGKLEVDSLALQDALVNHYDDVITMFSAGTSDQSRFGEANRGLAGDLDALVDDWLSSDGIIQSRIDSRETVKTRSEDDLLALDIRMDAVYDRYMTQFLAMEQAVDQLNNLKDSLESQLENLPFNNRDN